MNINVGISNRHIHLNEEDYIKLFGNTKIEEIKFLKQPGQYASNLKLNIKTDKGIIENIRVLVPLRYKK